MGSLIWLPGDEGGEGEGEDGDGVDSDPGDDGGAWFCRGNLISSTCS